MPIKCILFIAYLMWCFIAGAESFRRIDEFGAGRRVYFIGAPHRVNGLEVNLDFEDINGKINILIKRLSRPKEKIVIALEKRSLNQAPTINFTRYPRFRDLVERNDVLISGWENLVANHAGMALWRIFSDENETPENRYAAEATQAEITRIRSFLMARSADSLRKQFPDRKIFVITGGLHLTDGVARESLIADNVPYAFYIYGEQDYSTYAQGAEEIFLENQQDAKALLELGRQAAWPTLKEVGTFTHAKNSIFAKDATRLEKEKLNCVKILRGAP